MQCVFHSIRFKVNKVGIQRYPIFFALLSTRKRPQRKTLTSTKQTIYLWRNSHTTPPNHPKEERERNTHCANMQRRPEAKHCSSLCSQSEGEENCGKAESTTCANRASNHSVIKKSSKRSGSFRFYLYFWHIIQSFIIYATLSCSGAYKKYQIILGLKKHYYYEHLLQKNRLRSFTSPHFNSRIVFLGHAYTCKWQEEKTWPILGMED